MNEAVMFDTHQAFKDIHKGGSFTEEQADVLVKAMSGFVASHNADLATKGELNAGLAEVNASIENLRLATKGELNAGLAEVNASIENLRVATKADIAKLDAKIDVLDAKIDVIDAKSQARTSAFEARLMKVILTVGAILLSVMVAAAIYFGNVTTEILTRL